MVLAVQRTTNSNKLLLNTTLKCLHGSEAITVESTLASPITQKVLSGKIEEQLSKLLLESSCSANKAHLLSMSAPHAASWLPVVPSVGFGLHLECYEYQAALRW